MQLCCEADAQLIGGFASPSKNKHLHQHSEIELDGSTLQQGNRGDMRKIHVTRQFFKVSGPRDPFFEKNMK